MIRIFTLLAFTFLTVFQGFSQSHVNYNRDTRWFIGLNGGGTWSTQIEVPYRIRGGYGVTVGKSFGMEQDKIFSWDIRARFLHAQFLGQSGNRYNLDSITNTGLTQYGTTNIQTYQDSLGSFIPNYKTNLLSGSAELVLNTNRLRQNTGWNLSVFGGLGIKGYHTAADILNDSDPTTADGIYDYTNVASGSAGKILNFQDGIYETDLVGSSNNYEVDWMPSFGFGISKQVHPAVAIGIEHKMTWTRNNLFDGLPNNIDGTSSSLNDKYHYTNFNIKFHLFRGKGYTRTDPVPVDEADIDDFDTDPNPPIIDEPVSIKKPIVDIYDPSTSPYTTTASTFKVKANIYYVDARSGVTFKQDGNINTNFGFNPTTNKFESNVVLHPGQNLFEITGVNAAGSDYEAVIIVYKEEERPQNPPIVTITNPPYTPYKTTSNVFGLVSTILNVDSKSQIRVYLNGVNLSAFSYDSGSNGVTASLHLREGTNTVTVTGTNAVGSDSKTVEIIFERLLKTQPPIVSFVVPNVDPFYTQEAGINIKATALNVENKAGLTVLVNGNAVTSYSFNTGTKEIFFNTALIEGANIVEITGVNTAGSDNASTTIIYSRPETPRPPIVTFMDPGVDPITIYAASYNVTAKVEYVASAADITLRINGVTSTLFTYSSSSELMNFTTGLVEGSNVIEVKGVNQYGEDLETTTIIYIHTVPQAPPVVDITYPAVDNIIFESDAVTLEATVLNVAGAANINVLVNGIATGGFTYNNYTKVLFLPMTLIEGANVVQITGTNSTGSDTKTRIIIHKKPIVACPPTVHFVNPSASPYLVETADFTVTANTTHIDSKSQITFKQNGVLISNAAYSFVAGHQIAYNATLISGSNIFEVIVENADGSASDLTVINYEVDDQPCVIPTVGYIHPVPYSTVEDPAVIIDAQINNFSTGTTVELKLNGVSKGYMTYSASTSIASKAITLLEGSNAVNVIVTNACGTNQATFTLNYKAPDAPCYDPTLAAIGGATTIVTLEEQVSLSLAAAHVVSAAELSVKVNGTSIPFTFDAATGIITIADAGLAIGNNAITITANTACGAAVIVFNVTREECKTPVITNLQPVDGIVTDETSIVVNANISEAITSDIVMLVNGVSHVFAFNESTETLSEAISLEIGENVIVLQVQNACGATSKTVRVSRTIPCEDIITNLLNPSTNAVASTEDTYNITLNATGLSNSEQIVTKLNGAIVLHTFDPVSGDINLVGLSLLDGANTVTIAMNNACSKAEVIYAISYDGCEKPVIVMNSIHSGMVVTEGVFNLNAVVTNVLNGSDITLKLNGSNLDFDFNPTTHLLTAEFTLLEGSNTIDITASGCENESATATLTYERPCDKITHALMSPAEVNVTALEEQYNITLSTFGLDNEDQISAKLNGAAIPFSFNTATNIITISNITLVDGTNSVIVKLLNDCSSEVINYTINYDGCKPPVITLGSNSPTVETAIYTFEANVSNINGASELSVLANEVPVPFVFDPATGGLEVQVLLTEGANVITIIANGCQKVAENINVNYTVPCLPIITSLIHPNNVTAAVADPVYNISLVVQNATTENIEVKLNGSTIPFNYIDNVVNINGITLVDGENKVDVVITTPCDKKNVNYTIQHENCNTPEISLTANSLSSEVSGYSFVAVVANIETSSQLGLTLNGTNKTLSFDAATGTVTAFLSLNEGVNTIELTANGCETVKQSIAVVYTIPCLPVSYELASPSALITETELESVTLSLNVLNADTETVNVTLNGNPFNVNYSEGVLVISNVSLLEGSNTIVVNFGNNCSAESVTYVINHKACKKPSISINGLTEGMELSEKELVFLANLYDVEDAGDIVLKCNGIAVDFEYNTESQVLQAPLTLIKGTNSIEIAINGCEKATASVNVDYVTPCNPPLTFPSFGMITPAQSEVTVEGDSYTISLSTNSINVKGVIVKVNGAAVPFTFSSGTVIFDVAYASEPSNDVTVELSNKCGSVTATYTVNFEVPEENCAPVVAATFTVDNKAVTVTSAEKLINVILNLEDGATQLFGAVSGTTGTFKPTGEHQGKCIVGVWIRSGCNVSSAGEPFGEYVPNNKWNGMCVAPCSPVTFKRITPNSQSSMTTVSPYKIVFSTANIASATGVSATVNGIKSTVSFSNNMVTLNGIKLVKGINKIIFSLTNDCSTKKVVYNINYNPTIGGGKINGDDGNGIKTNGGIKDQTVVKPTPVITPMSPASTRATVKSQTLSFKAKVLNITSKSNVKITVNGVNFPGFIYNSSTKQISANIRLNQGVNMIKVNADNGKSKGLTYYITYQKPTVDANKTGGTGQTGTVKAGGTLTPKLTRINPKTASYSTKTPSFTLRTKAINVRTKSDLTLTLNGVRITNFTFSSSTKQLTAILRLKEGTNNIRVDAKNGDKKAALTYKIIYNKPAKTTGTTNRVESGGTKSGGTVTTAPKKPTFRYVNPTGTTKTVTKEAFTLKTTIANVSSKSNITYTVNGRRVSGFTFNASNGSLVSTLKLKPGANSIQITAKNGSQVATVRYTITYNAPKSTTGTVKSGTTNGGRSSGTTSRSGG